MKKIVVLLFIINWTSLAIAEPVEKAWLLSLLNQTESFIIEGNYDRAAELCEQSMEMFKNLGADNDVYTISGLHKISHAYAEKNIYGEAIKTESLLVDVFPLVMPDKVLDYALFLNDLALYCMYNKQVESAEQNIQKALSLINEEKSEKVAVIYFRAAEIYQLTTPPRLDLSIKYQKRVVDIYADMYGKDSSKYLDELWFLALYYEEAGEYNQAGNTYLEILNTQVADESIEDLDRFLPLLDRIIFCCRKTKNLEQEKQYKRIAFLIKSKQGYHEAKYPRVDFPTLKDSLEYMEISEAIDSIRVRLNSSGGDGDERIYKLKKEKLDSYFASLPDTYAKAYALSIETMRNSLQFNSESAIEYGTNAMDIYDKLGLITADYVIVLCCIAEAYNELDNPAKAYEYGLKAFDLRDDYLSSNMLHYTGILHDLSIYCSKLGNYGDAIKYGLLDAEASESLIYTDLPYRYFSSMENLALLHGEIGEYDIELNILENLVGKAEEIDSMMLAFPENSILYNLANCYLQKGDYPKAIEIGKKVKELREKGAGNSFISSIYLLLGKAYRLNGDLEDALHFAKLANNMQKEMGRDDNLALANTYCELAYVYKGGGQYVEAERMMRNTIGFVSNNIINNFLELSSNDRTSYWKIWSNAFNIFYPNYFYSAKIGDATELYNKSALFAKGILLNTDTEISKLIIESGDLNALKRYQQLLANRSLLLKLASNNNSQTKMSIDSIGKEIDEMERELIKECKAFGDYTKSMKTTWRDVQASLSYRDVAIEFLSFPLIDANDSILDKKLYVALVLKKSDTSPRCIYLFDEGDLNKYLSEGNYDMLYRLIWVTLDNVISGAENIYFSPSGMLNNINIEALPDIVGINSDKNYYRVSSTRELVYANDAMNDAMGSAVIYGGINYETSVAGLIEDSKKYFSKASSYRGDVGKLDLRAGWDYLPETLTEVNDIYSMLKKNNIQTKIFTDTLGTEASFKSIDHKPNSIIHIATHGFYYRENEVAEMTKKNLHFMVGLLDRKSRSYTEDYPLVRSGLLLAGCNNILHGCNIPADEDDGILYAREIANMNLNNVELVTLSSCESGLGDVTAEGVWGLQRAFKKAGVNTVLMSLNKVDDEATRILMVEFYRNLMNGKTKRQSLKEAQQYLRKVDNGKFDDPKYWASFIMLDGLN